MTILISLKRNSANAPVAFIACQALRFFHSTYPDRDRAERIARLEMKRRGIAEYTIRHV